MEWGVGRQLAAALCLSQPYLPAGAVDRTARLLEVLQVGWSTNLATAPEDPT